MRVKLGHLAVGVLLVGAAFALATKAPAQSPDSMMPEASAAKAKQILSDLVNARGAAGYLGASEMECSGNRAIFGHNEMVSGYIAFTDSRQYPDKQRMEYDAKAHNLKSVLNTIIGVEGLDWFHGGVVIAVYNGDRGWTLDRSGITELPVTSTAEFQEQTKRNIDNVLRIRLKNEQGWFYRFGGSDTVDLKEVEWAELTDPEGRQFRLAVDHNTRLLVRSVVTTVNDETRERDDDVTTYTNYQLKDTVWTPMQVSREHNGRRASQFFYTSCRYNPGFPADFFDKSSLSKKASAAGAKKSKNVDQN